METGAELDAAQRAVAEQGLKALMPVGRPVLDYALTLLADGGCTDVCLVIGPEHRAIRDHVAALPLTRLKVTFAEQAKPKGTADAVLAAERFVSGDHFVVVNGDNLYPAQAIELVRKLPGSGLAAFMAYILVNAGNLRPERVGRFPLVRSDASGMLTELVERDATPGPGNGKDERISMNCWAFTPAIFDACRAVTPSPRGELEITEAARVAMRRGERFTALPVNAAVLDVTSRGDVATMAARIADLPVRL
jgi:glucose-1-phosphate thymidylyltransferase